MDSQHFEVLIIGAGLSGIGMACHLSHHCPQRRFAILERRQALGGTWDLFRYPGIRSDSDMFSFGYALRPWNGLKVLADGASIRQYLGDTAREFGVDQHIHYGVDLLAANWSSAQRRWQLIGRDSQTGEARHFSCDFLLSCTGYYDHAAGHQPDFPGMEQFRGRFVHPQQWPEDLDYRDKRVVVIGSGATAVTLVPALAEQAAQVTMLQRSPSYIFSMPSRDKLSALLLKVLPERWVYHLARQRNISVQRQMFKAAKRWPRFMRWLLLRGVRKELGEDHDLSHFTPRYQPWDERLCAVPDGDLFKALKAGKAQVVTGAIETLTAAGVRLQSGQELPADIIVSATGLKMQLLGGMQLSIDGEPCRVPSKLVYKGVLVQDVPNAAWIFGYTNASWTLKADIAAEYVCRLLNHLGEHGQQVFVARDEQGCALDSSVMSSLNSGYVRRADGILPRQGDRAPWQVLNDYRKDVQLLCKGPIEDGILRFEAFRAGGAEETAGAEGDCVQELQAGR
ncbi:flavin-containing monooxygenase [Pseudomonas sp. BMS12]|uniref:flavin-containing monooxygenase n=1 Tax=Pseudomonas sp. BMS12 TaxID=1796033 RepID=UPI00083A9097|nr:NAD(P)/FAD-dependent oxidoreductase [Pseudomonas sp. BMS12]